MAADDQQVLTEQEVTGTEGLEGWHIDDGWLTATFDTGDFETGLALVNGIGEAAEEANHHPDLVLTYPTVEVRLMSHDVGGLTQRDVRMALRSGELAAEAGVAAQPTTDS